ncbi:MAG: hypothetical protein HQL99_15390 [Magnetococcales bacterium]|nr:hypothetical protein [Magnetococcales bacterium]
MNTFEELKRMFNNRLAVEYGDLCGLFGYDNVGSFRSAVNSSQAPVFRGLREVGFMVGKRKLFKLEDVAAVWDRM